MDKFLSLPLDKQNTIINAALRSFGTNGYKKTSISDIANAAGISKAMVFHYFGTKKALYLYLAELCGNTIMNEVNEKFDNTITDFFERIKLSSDIEMAAIKKYPAITSFITSMYFEKDEGVRDDLKAMMAGGEAFRNKIAFDNIDYSKFKGTVDLKLLMNMLLWLADGFATQMSNNPELDFDNLCQEFYQCLNMLRDNFYKEEYV